MAKIRIAQKIPSELLSMRKSEEKHAPDLSKMDTPQLQEIRDRQLKLLKNTFLVNKLEDKGARVRELLEKVNAQLRHLQQIDATAKLFSSLNIVANGKEAINKLEWNNDTVAVDSDDDEPSDDPLKLLSRTDCQKVVVVEKPIKTLVTEEDLKQIAEFEETSAIVDQTTVIEPHVAYVCSKEHHGPDAAKFRPHQSKMGATSDLSAEMGRKVPKNWEVTAASPPPLKHPGVKQIPLMESILLQERQNTETQKLQKEHAELRLRAKRPVRDDYKMLMKMSSGFSDYRDLLEMDSDVSEDDDDDYDLEDVD